LQLFRLLHQLLLPLITTPAARRGRSLPLLRKHAVPCVQLLLPLRQFFQPLQRFIDLLVPGLLFAALYGFVLIFEFVQFQLKQIRQVFGIRLRPASGSALHPERHLDFPEKTFGAQELLQRFLFRWQRTVRFPGSQVNGRLPHLANGVAEVFR